MIVITSMERLAIEELARRGKSCGCVCHDNQKCPYAEYIGDSICIPLLAARMVEYTKF